MKTIAILLALLLALAVTFLFGAPVYYFTRLWFGRFSARVRRYFGGIASAMVMAFLFVIIMIDCDWYPWLCSVLWP